MGEWITFLDADDRITPDHLQRYVDAVEQAETRPDIVVGGLLQIRSKENLEVENKIKGGMDRNEYIRTCGEVINNAPWNKLYHKSVIEGHSFNTDYTISEDQLFNLQVLLDAKNIITIPMTGYRYICNDESSAMSRFHATLEETKKETQKILDTLCLQTGMTEEEVRQAALKKKFLQGYFNVCNLFKPGCPYSLRRKHNEIERMIFKDKEMAESARMYPWSPQGMFIKIWIACYKTHSAWFTTLAFALQYWAKRNMRPLYFKIVPWLRK